MAITMREPSGTRRVREYPTEWTWYEPDDEEFPHETPRQEGQDRPAGAGTEEPQPVPVTIHEYKDRDAAQ